MTAPVTAVILGAGASSGTPRLGNDWGACDPAEPKNRRRRASLLIRCGATTVLVDTSPDCRAQLLDAGVDRLDAIVWTHDHADHTHGIDDVRPLAWRQGGPIRGYADPTTLAALHRRFDYVFEAAAAGEVYRPFIAAEPVAFGAEIAVNDLTLRTFRQEHGPGVASLGLRAGPLAYSTDVNHLPEAAFDVLAGVATWVVDCMSLEPHPTHSWFDRTLEWIARVQPRRAILSHLSPNIDYRTLSARCPEGVELAYDGMRLS